MNSYFVAHVYNNNRTLTFDKKCNNISGEMFQGCLTFMHSDPESYLILAVIPIQGIVYVEQLFEEEDEVDEKD